MTAEQTVTLGSADLPMNDARMLEHYLNFGGKWPFGENLTADQEIWIEELRASRQSEQVRAKMVCTHRVPTPAPG